MIARPRSLLLLAALAVGVATSLGGPLVPAGAQDATSTTAPAFGGAPTQASDPSATASTIAAGAVDDPAAPEATQTLTEGASEERSLLTESRKVLATIGGLVIAAIGLALLTIRYWRATKPVPAVQDRGAGGPSEEPPLPMIAPEVALSIWTTDAPIGAPARGLLADDGPGAPASPRAVAGADHARADDDWEPRGTGEHDVVAVPPASTPRPGTAARAAALGRSPEEDRRL